MNKKLVLISYKVGFALLVIGAVTTQISYSSDQLVLSLGDFFSYFTILSIIFATATFIVSALALVNPKSDKDRRILDYLRGAAVTFILVSGIIYSTLLNNADVNTPLAWVNMVLHYLFPLIVLADWLFDRPTGSIVYKNARYWLVFPAAYVVYSLIRGASIGWYPYPFLDVSKHGYVVVLASSIALLAGVACVALFVAWLSRLTLATPKLVVRAAKSKKK
jgi:uncharacterized membrane protein SirB2